MRRRMVFIKVTALLSQCPFELEPDDVRPPQVIDWDSADSYLMARFIDELVD